MGATSDPFDSAQRIDSGFFSGVLRIDVDRNPAKSHPIRRQPRNLIAPPAGWPNTFSNANAVDGYFIPNDNPWLDPNGSVLEEFYAIGLRSPHRMTIDRITNQIWIGDVGDATREEVDLLKKGANFQWPFREGSMPGPKARPATVIGTETPPVHDYSRDQGNCVIGGIVYRGQRFAAQFGGTYIFADNGSQSVFAMSYTPGLPGQVNLIVTGPNGNELSGISSVGEDAAAELYFLKLAGSNKPGATILQLEPETAFEVAPALLSQTGAFVNLQTLQTRAGLLPYDVNSPLWSDGAEKRRWFAIPNDGVANSPGETIAFSETGEWSFPVGTVFMKHFMLPTDLRNPSVQRWLETRFLVRASDGDYYGLTYRWRPDRSDADLLASSLDESIPVTDANGITGQLAWHYPSRSECLFCHSVPAEQVLGVKTRQLNGLYSYPSTGIVDNQLRAINHLGFLSPALNEAAIPSFLTSAPLSSTQDTVEHRVLSYLDSNCAQCHRPGGVRANFDTRLSTPLALQNIVNGGVENSLGIPGSRVVLPRDPARSLLLQRVISLDSCCAMPPLAKSTVHTEAVDLITQWILELDPSQFQSPCPCHLFKDTDLPAIASSSDGGAVELGVKFQTEANGNVAGIRFFKGSGNTGQHRGNLWRSDGTLLATALFTNETISGWQTVLFSSPVAISHGNTYIASYHAPFGHFAVTLDYFTTVGITSPPLRAPPASEVGANGVYRYGTTSGYPDQSYRASNYWVDVVFSESSPGTLPPSVASTLPQGGATSVQPTVRISVTFKAALDPLSVTNSTFILRDSSGLQVSASVTHDGLITTTYLTPSSVLERGVTYTATLKGGSSGLKSVSGTPLLSDVSWSFTTASTLESQFVRADANGDGLVDISDAIRTLLMMFLGEGEPACHDAVDSNDDGRLDLSDVLYTLAFLFREGLRPPAPYPAPGPDPTPDNLGCVSTS